MGYKRGRSRKKIKVYKRTKFPRKAIKGEWPKKVGMRAIYGKCGIYVGIGDALLIKK